jgi:two-component system, NarL family, response regulator LiaR
MRTEPSTQPHGSGTPTGKASVPAGGPRARIIIADSDPLARRAIRDGFEPVKDFIVIAEARDGVEVAELALHYRPELVLLEATLPRIDGIAAMKRILAGAPDTRVVMLSSTDGSDTGLAALRGGASGFLAKDMGMEGVIASLRCVMAGEIATSVAMNRRLVSHLRSTPEFGIGMRPVKSVLTSREWEMLDLLTLGCSTAQIADELYVTVETVQSHIKNLKRKLGVHCRAEAVERGKQLRWLADEPTLSVAA